MLLMLVVFSVIIYLLLNFVATMQESSISLFMMIFTILIIYLILLPVISQFARMYRVAKMRQIMPSLLSVIKCQDCNYVLVREFLTGDYVFKNVGKCYKCGGNLYIDAIYLTSEKKGKGA